MAKEKKDDCVVPYIDTASDGTVLGGGTFNFSKPYNPQEIEASIDRAKFAAAMHEAGKAGSGKGPARVNSRAFRDNYEAIFGKKDPEDLN